MIYIMKKLCLTLFLSVLLLPLSAQEKENRPKISRLVVSMERLWRADSYLESMDTATYILTLQPTNRTATDFIYRHWDEMQESTRKQLLALPDEDDLEQAMQRCEIYRLLDEINSHFGEIPLPLCGANDRWVWQPEVSYYTGHYDAARSKVVDMLKVRADAALLSHDVDAAKGYYTLLLDKYLVTEGERLSNKDVLLEKCNERLRLYVSSEKISDALFAWDLLQLSLTLEPQQEDMLLLKSQLQEHIASLYLKRAEQSLLQGDSIQAREFELYAEDWQVSGKTTEP